jgi:hypothetical protein
MQTCCSDVKDFGATGDGITDDTAAIQAAVDAVTPGGGCICIPPGAYLISQPLTVEAPIDICGAGRSSIVKAKDDSFHLFILNKDATGSHLTGLQMQGAATSDATRQFAIFTDEASIPTNITIDHLLISGPNDTTGCNSGIKLDTGANDWTISHNHFERLIGTTDGHGYGVLLGTSLRNIITHNHFTGGTGQCRHAVYLSAGTSYNIVAHNLVKDFHEEAFPINTYKNQPASQYNQIVNNTIINGGQFTTDSAAISITGVSSYNRVEGNTIVGYKGHGIIITDGGTKGLCIGNQVIGNSIYKVGWVGILIMGAKHTDVHSNVVFNSSQYNNNRPPKLEPGTWYGIDIRSVGSFGKEVCEGTNIVGNTSSGPSQRAAFDINPSDPVPTNTVVFGNKFLAGANPGTAYALNHVECLFDDNVADQNRLRLGGP